MKRTLFAGLLASVVSVSAVAGDMMKKDIVDTAPVPAPLKLC